MEREWRHAGREILEQETKTINNERKKKKKRGREMKLNIMEKEWRYMGKEKERYIRTRKGDYFKKERKINDEEYIEAMDR